MPYIPRAIQVWQALREALRAGFNAELEEIGQPPMAEMGFAVRDPQLIAGESVVVFYDATSRDLQAKYWIESQWVFYIHLRTVQPDDLSLNMRLMYMEYAAVQVLQKSHTLGGLLRTLKPGDTMPWGISKGGQGVVADSIFIPVACQPNERVPNPERSLP